MIKRECKLTVWNILVAAVDLLDTLEFNLCFNRPIFILEEYRLRFLTRDTKTPVVSLGILPRRPEDSPYLTVIIAQPVNEYMNKPIRTVRTVIIGSIIKVIFNIGSLADVFLGYPVPLLMAFGEVRIET